MALGCLRPKLCNPSLYAIEENVCDQLETSVKVCGISSWRFRSQGPPKYVEGFKGRSTLDFGAFTV